MGEATRSGPGPFGPRSLTWKVNRESVLLLGGGRALILQVAHPKVAAGVGQHSNYREEPWRRLYRTLDVTLRIVFGDAEASAEASRQLRERHKQVQGLDDRGERYYALDPDLLLWVHATLIDTSLVIYERYVGRLTPRQKADYYEEQKALGELYGIPREHMPADFAAFRRYWGEMLAGELRVTETLRDVADAVLNPDVPRVARPVFDLVNLVTVGTLPPGVREMLGLGWGPRRERVLTASQAAIRRLMPVIPGVVRSFPPARRALGRAA